MDRERMERCLERVAAYRASGLKASVWAQGNGVSIRCLSSWCAHATRWKARLDGVPGATTPRPQASGFVGARVPAAPAATVRIAMQTGAGQVELYWPVTHARELATWLREVGR